MKVEQTKFTVGDCVTVLGRPWARENNIQTAKDMKKPAPEEWAKLAQWAVATQESLVEAKKFVKAAHTGERFKPGAGASMPQPFASLAHPISCRGTIG
jgi:hypothetical protein